MTRVVLVTGAAGGIGSAVAQRFAAEGWAVADTDIANSSYDADLRTAAASTDVVDRVVTDHGRLDAVITCAGVWTEGRVDDTREDDFDRVMDVNVKGTFFVTAAATPHLEATGGHITMISSDAGIQGNAGAAVYSASKGAVSNLARALALELAPRGVRVNAVCPGDVDSPMLAGQARDHGGDDPEGYLRNLLCAYPQGARARFTRPDEVAALVWFLATDAAAPITGANLSIDFGLSAGLH